jgi:hypothetical protein
MTSKPVKRRTNDALKFVIEAKFDLPNVVVPNREEELCENSLAYSNKYGLLFLCNDRSLKAVIYKNIESGMKVADSNNSNLSNEQILCEQTFEERVQGIRLSASEKYVLVTLEQKILIYALEDFNKQVLIKSSNFMFFNLSSLF